MGIHTEVNTLNNPLDGNGVEVWGAFTQTTFGSEKFAWYINMQAGSVYHWRARLRFNPTSQPYLPATRWLSLPYHGWNEADLHTLYWSNYLPVILQD